MDLTRIDVPFDALDEMRRMQAERPPMPKEHVFWSAVGLTLGVPKDWNLDLERGGFFPPKVETEVSYGYADDCGCFSCDEPVQFYQGNTAT